MHDPDDAVDMKIQYHERNVPGRVLDLEIGLEKTGRIHRENLRRTIGLGSLYALMSSRMFDIIVKENTKS